MNFAATGQESYYWQVLVDMVKKTLVSIKF